jgi:hypothetical protein
LCEAARLARGIDARRRRKAAVLVVSRMLSLDRRFIVWVLQDTQRDRDQASTVVG